MVCAIMGAARYPLGHHANSCNIRARFNFLGFTHICGRSRRGNFLLIRQTRRDWMRAKLRELKTELRKRMHQPIPVVGRWLGQVVRGFPVSRCADQRPQAVRIPLLRGAAVVANAETSQSTRWLQREATRPSGDRLAATGSYLSPLAGGTLCRQSSGALVVRQGGSSVRLRSSGLKDHVAL